MIRVLLVLALALPLVAQGAALRAVEVAPALTPDAPPEAGARAGMVAPDEKTARCK